MTAEEAMHERAERLGLSLVAEPAGAPPATPVADSPWDSAAWGDATRATVREWDAAYGERAPNGRRTKVITGRPDGAPRPLSLVARRAAPPAAHARRVGRREAGADRGLGVRPRPDPDPRRHLDGRRRDRLTRRGRPAAAHPTPGAPNTPARLAGTRSGSYTYEG